MAVFTYTDKTYLLNYDINAECSGVDFSILQYMVALQDNRKEASSGSTRCNQSQDAFRILHSIL